MKHVKDIKFLNFFFVTLIEQLNSDSKLELTDLFVRTLSLLLDENPEDVRLNPIKMQIILIEKIKNTSQLFSKSLSENTKNDAAVEKEILEWKKKMNALGIDEESNLSIIGQVQDLFKATQTRNLKEMGRTFKELSQYVEASDRRNLLDAFDVLKKQLPSHNFDNITKSLTNGAPHQIATVLNQISEKLNDSESEPNLDEIVNLLEEKLGNLFSTDKENKKTEYKELAQASIRKSLLAHGIKPLN